MKGASCEATERIDAELAAEARVESALRLRLGQVLELIARGACFELGFSSFTAYALERCARSARWCLAARCLAHRLEALPELRRALALGHVSWSKAELVAPVAANGNEARWVEAAQRLTVRELRALVKESAPSPADASLDGPSLDDGDEVCTLVCTVDREEAWLFEATRALLGELGTHGTDEQVEALLAEAQINLFDALPSGAVELTDAPVDMAQAQWGEQLARWRAEAEARCEANFHPMNENGVRALVNPHEFIA